MESFNTELLPDTYRLRESWLSSMIPCLGLAEVLGSPVVRLAGADLSYSPHGAIYQGPNDPDADPRHCRAPLLDMAQPRILLQDRNGSDCLTTFAYFATAGEAETIMRELTQARGTRFEIVGNTGIISQTCAAPTDLVQMLTGPVINRTKLNAALDQQDKTPAQLNLIALKARQLHLLQVLREQQIFFATLQTEHLAQHARHPIIRSLHGFSANGRIPHIPDADMPSTLRQTLTYWENLTRRNLSWILFITALHKGTKIPLLAVSKDKTDASISAAPASPNFCRYTLTESTSGPLSVPYSTLHEWLVDRLMIVATPESLATIGRIIPWLQLPHVLKYTDIHVFLKHTYGDEQ